MCQKERVLAPSYLRPAACKKKKKRIKERGDSVPTRLAPPLPPQLPTCKERFLLLGTTTPSNLTAIRHAHYHKIHHLVDTLLTNSLPPPFQDQRLQIQNKLEVCFNILPYSRPAILSL